MRGNPTDLTFRSQSARPMLMEAELLRFPIPQERFIRQFDELVVRFQRLAVRSHQSANISIERFVLVPVGR